MKTIHKFQLNTSTLQIVYINEGYELLTVQMQNGVACLWAKIETDHVVEPVTIMIVGTGYEIPKGRWTYISTIQHETLVWHIFSGVVV